MEHPGVGSLMPALRLLHQRGHELALGFEALKSVESHRELQDLAGETAPGSRSCSCRRWGAPAGWRSPPGCGGASTTYATSSPATRRRRACAPARRARRPARPARLRAARRSSARPGSTALQRDAPGARVLPGAAEAHPRPSSPSGSPDVLLLAHLLPIGTTHADYLRAAKRLGIRTAFPVRSWDNLTNKGLLHDAPDAVLVWNDLQAAEAVELHGVPAETVRVTGAPLFDHVVRVGAEPHARGVLRRRRPARRPPDLLYVCSSGFVAPNEVDFVRSWIERLRAAAACSRRPGSSSGRTR